MILHAVRNSGPSEQRKKREKEELKKAERTKGALKGADEPGFVELLFPQGP